MRRRDYLTLATAFKRAMRATESVSPEDRNAVQAGIRLAAVTVATVLHSDNQRLDCDRFLRDAGVQE